MKYDLMEILQKAIELKASDIHFTVAKPLLYCVERRLDFLRRGSFDP